MESPVLHDSDAMNIFFNGNLRTAGKKKHLCKCHCVYGLLVQVFKTCTFSDQ